MDGKQAHGWAGKGVEMLVLERMEDEIIMIGDDIEIVIVAFRGFKNDNRRVKIGIRAPVNIPIHRKEIYDIIQKEKENGHGQESAD